MNAVQRPVRRGPRILLAVLLGAAAAAGVYLYVTNVQQTAQAAAAQQVTALTAAATAANSQSRAVVAKQTLSAQTALTADNVELKTVPPDGLQPNVETDLSDVLGKSLLVPVATGQQILAPFLSNATPIDPKTLADLVPTGKRAMSVSFTELNSAGGLVQPGDSVDVIGVFDKNTLGKDQSMLLIQNVPVLAVAAQAAASQPLQQGAPAGTQPQASPPQPQRGSTTAGVAIPLPTLPSFSAQSTRTLTLAVDPEAAERLALAEDYGHLRYIVRPKSDQNQSAVMPADLSTLASPIQVAQGQILATQITPSNTKVGDTIDVSITVKNTSDKPLQTMGPDPGFTYVQGQTYFTQQYASDPGKWRVGIGTAGLDSTDLPYRWGLGGDLAPGATTTVTGHIKVTQDFKATNFWAALVNEPSNVVQSGAGMTLVTSLPQNLAIVAVDAANVRSSPSIAASVLQQVKYGTELQLIGQSADWFKVKLPDQSEGWVAAGWIVTAGQ